MTQTVADIIAAKLHQTGCRNAFGMPGGEVLKVMHAMNVEGIEFTLCKHENSAGFMAEGSWHATGAPGILLTTIGPGLANGLNSVANAFQEQVPLFVISGCVQDGEAQSFTHQIIDQKALLTPITKASFQVTAESVDKIMDKAITIALADPPGPVHIDVPHNVAGVKAQIKQSLLAQPRLGVWPEGDDLDVARAMLANARNPIMVAGLGALHHKAGEQIRALCERFSMPLITTYKAKGILDEHHALALGGHGLSPRSDAVILPLLAQSDCVILAGYDPIEMRQGWIEPWNSEQAIDLIHADIQHGMHGAAIRFVGDVAASLEKLGTNIEPSPDIWQGGEIEAARSSLDEIFSESEQWGPHKVFAIARKALPQEGVITIDSGAHRILLSQMWKCKKPLQILQSTCFCTMGISLPLAIGYAKSKNSKRTSQHSNDVIVFVGDAGLEMVMGELATLRDTRIPVVIIVMVDESLALIELKQASSKLPNLGVDFAPTDFVSIAKAYGGNAHWIEDEKSLERALGEASGSDRFTLLACKIDKQQYAGAF